MSLYESLTIVFGLAVFVFGMLQAFKMGYSAGKGEQIGDQYKSFDDMELIDPNEDEKAKPIEELMEEDDDGEEGN